MTPRNFLDQEKGQRRGGKVGYRPHQGAKEKIRRRRQLAEGRLTGDGAGSLAQASYVPGLGVVTFSIEGEKT